MTHYTIQPGVVLASVCGQALLVATRPAWGKCPYINQLNETGAYFWSHLEQGLDTEQIVQAAAQHYDAAPERIRTDLLTFLQALQEHGYLLPEDKAQSL